MKIILLQDVARIGRKGSIVEVPDGFAQNKLIPKKMAEPATPANLKKAEKLKADADATKGAIEDQFKTAVANLKGTPVVISAEANEKEHLFKAISVEEIVTTAKNAGVTLDPAMIAIPTPIKSLGQHEVQLQWQSLKDSFVVEVVSK